MAQQHASGVTSPNWPSKSRLSPRRVSLLRLLRLQGRRNRQIRRSWRNRLSFSPSLKSWNSIHAADPTQLEKSLVVLSKLKELEFHSRGNIEKLAELSLTIEEELKQKAFAEAIGAVYTAQDAFQSKILKLIDAYEAECARLRPAG